MTSLLASLRTRSVRGTVGVGVSVARRRRTALSRPPSSSAAAAATLTDTPAPTFDDADYAGRHAFPPAPRIVFPHTDGQFQLGDGAKQRVDADTVIRVLWPVISESRRRKIAAVVARRSYSMLPLLDGTYDIGNASAVARSADAMGLGALHINASEGFRFKRSRRTSKGSDRWLDLWRWRADTVGAIHALQNDGFRVLVAMPPSERAKAMTDWDLGGPRQGAPPTAVVFGNELEGVSAEAVDAADGQITIPMAGFSESFNVSVAASLVLAEAYRQRGGQGDLPPDQARLLLASYLLRAVRGRDMQWLLWLNPEQASEEAEARAELLAGPLGWRRRMQAKRESRGEARAAGTEAAVLESGGGAGGSGSGSSLDEEEDQEGSRRRSSDALTAEESERFAKALEEELRRSGGGGGGGL
jgi:tRNA (guanosine-2'-O-)-methyltransferase